MKALKILNHIITAVSTDSVSLTFNSSRTGGTRGDNERSPMSGFGVIIPHASTMRVTAGPVRPDLDLTC